jgi:hypothetical protein
MLSKKGYGNDLNLKKRLFFYLKAGCIRCSPSFTPLYRIIRPIRLLSRGVRLGLLAY